MSSDKQIVFSVRGALQGLLSNGNLQKTQIEENNLGKNVIQAGH